MKRVLILFAHPRFEKSRVNRALLRGLSGLDGVTIHDLYEHYPDFNVDVGREQELLLQHDIIVWHYPLYLYGPPALVKQWMDLVLEHGWAHGDGGGKLLGKLLLNAITSGGTRQSFAPDGFNRFSLAELLRPLERAARLCRLIWLPPFVVQGTYRLTDIQLADYAERYRRALFELARTADLDPVLRVELLNDWIAELMHKEQP